MRAAAVATVMTLCLGAVGYQAVRGPSAAPRAVARTSVVAAAHDLGAPDCRAGHDARASGPEQIATTVLRTGRFKVNVFAHVLRTESRGGVARSQIRRQVAVLNAAFAGRQSPFAAGSPFRFRLADVDVTVRRAWYRMDEGSLAEQHAKHALHRGTSADLNLYIGSNSAGVLGWGSQPTRYRESPKLDGVVIARHTLPGGRDGRYSAGDDAVHETGHWLGLFHTFAGSCTSRGDRVADTPAEASPSFGCHVHRDTCSGPGTDPVHNFMDYSTDACMNQFTRGQVARMVLSWERLRDTASA